MAFKLGSEKRGFKHSGNVDIIRTPLDKGTIAEANNDGTISISPHVKPGSALYKKAVKHEMAHIEQMEDGRADYDDNWVMWEGEKHDRKNGKIKYKGTWYAEGSNALPWEKKAVRAENREYYA